VTRAGNLVCYEVHDLRPIACPGDDCRPSGPPPKPTPVKVAADVRMAAGANNHLCVVTRAGQVLCRGRNAHGILGGNRWEVKELTPVPGLDRIRFLATSDHHACAVREDGHLLCWGSARMGFAGGALRANLPNEADATVVLVPGIDDAEEVAVGDFHSCVLRRGGRVACFGNNEVGQVGSGAPGESQIPQRATILDHEAGDP
jgi:alpha-tubulin suppressor-like RCC1 family protein